MDPVLLPFNSPSALGCYGNLRIAVRGSSLWVSQDSGLTWTEYPSVLPSNYNKAVFDEFANLWLYSGYNVDTGYYDWFQKVIFNGTGFTTIPSSVRGYFGYYGQLVAYGDHAYYAYRDGSASGYVYGVVLAISENNVIKKESQQLEAWGYLDGYAAVSVLSNGNAHFVGQAEVVAYWEYRKSSNVFNQLTASWDHGASNLIGSVGASEAVWVDTKTLQLRRGVSGTWISLPAPFAYVSQVSYIKDLNMIAIVGSDASYNQLCVGYDLSTSSWTNVLTVPYKTYITRRTYIPMAPKIVYSGKSLPVILEDYPSGKYYYYEFSWNTPPDTPTPTKFTANGYTLNRRPKFYFVVSDPDGDRITDIRVQISSKSDFSTLYLDDRYSSSVYTTFSGMPANSGGTVSLQVTGGNPLIAGSTYYIRAQVKDAKGDWSGWSTPQAFTVASVPWSDTVPSDATAFKAEWMNQIATAINAARQFRGLTTFSFTDGTIVAGQTDIKAVHVTERQKALQEVLTTIGVWQEICPDGGAESGTARYKGGAYRTNADKYVGSYCHALLTNEDWNGLYLVPSSGYTLYPGIVYRVAAMIKNPTPRSGYINLFTTELWTNSGLGAKTLPAGMDWTLYEWFFTVEEIKTVSHLRIEESGFNGYSGEIYLDLLTLRPAWTHELNLLATTVLGADADWSKWQHYNNTNWYYWDHSSQYNHELYGRVFQGQAVTDRPTAFLFHYGNYPFAAKAGQPYLFGLWVKLSPGQTATATVRAYFRKPDGSNLVQEDRQVTLTQDWQYLEFILTPTRSMNVGIGWAFTGIQGLTLHAAMPVVRPLVDRSGIHIQELRNYLLHT